MYYLQKIVFIIFTICYTIISSDVTIVFVLMHILIDVLKLSGSAFWLDCIGFIEAPLVVGGFLLKSPPPNTYHTILWIQHIHDVTPTTIDKSSALFWSCDNTIILWFALKDNIYILENGKLLRCACSSNNICMHLP